jgi:serine/threonine protein kinase
MARTFVGTPIYMSPQVLNQKQYTNKTDIWSLGVMFYELLFAKLPYSGFSEQDLYRNIMQRGLQLPECSKDAQRYLKGMLTVDEASRWGWDDVFDAFIGKAFRARGKTPTTGQQSNNGVFYAQEKKKEKSYEEKKEGGGGKVLPRFERIESRDHDHQARTPPHPSANSYMDNVYDHQNRNHDHVKKPQGKNMLIPQEESLDEIYIAPVNARGASKDDEKDENPRFYYFILVEYVVNPLEGSLSFDSFMYTLWKTTITLYEKMLEKPEVTSIQLYKNVLTNELTEVRNM